MSPQADMTAAEYNASKGKGGRRKGGKAPNEDPVHRAIVQYLWLVLPPGAILHHSPNEQTASDQREAAIRQAGYKLKGLLPGWPDLVVIYRRTIVFLEVKAPGGLLSKEQRRFRDQVTDPEWEWPWAMVTSPAEADAALRKAGIPLKRCQI